MTVEKWNRTEQKLRTNGGKMRPGYIGKRTFDLSFRIALSMM